MFKAMTENKDKPRIQYLGKYSSDIKLKGGILRQTTTKRNNHYQKVYTKVTTKGNFSAELKLSWVKTDEERN